MTYPPFEESWQALDRAGWSATDSRHLGPDGPEGGSGWGVTAIPVGRGGLRGENYIQVWAKTRDEAWWQAVQQAESLGMLGR
jgi:hypothetical protein